MHLNLECFDKFPLLETPRLILRQITADDISAIFKMRADKRVNKFISRTDMDDPAAAAALVDKTIKAYQSKAAIGWSGILKSDNSVIGTCGFNSFDHANMRAEIGGEMDVSFWGKKLAPEAFAAIITYGLSNINLHTIEAKIAPGNKSAIALVEQLGFTREALYKERVFFNGQFSDMAVYTLHNPSHQLG